MAREDDRSMARKTPRHTQPVVPAWDQAGPPVPWWEAVGPYPCADRRVSLEPATSGSESESPADVEVLSVLPPAGGTGTGERGWTPMKRILIALMSLAALFLVAGAHSQW
jgi:hypothetical protein